MIIMGIETSSRISSVSLVDTDGARVETAFDGGFVHSDRLLPMIDELTRKNKISIHKLHGIAVSTGPGSFTGTRVGVSVARGLSQGLDIRLAGVSSLDGLAGRAMAEHKPAGDTIIICPIIDALREEVYTALYTIKGKNLKRLTDYKLISINTLLGGMKNKKVYFVGDAVDLYEDRIKAQVINAVIAGPRERYASALSIALEGMKLFSGNHKADYKDILPRYIRKPEAEIKWKERKK